MKHTDILKENNNETATDLVATESETRDGTSSDDKNRDFSQVYPKGWDVMLNLPSRSPHVARLYAFLAKHIAPLGGAVCVSYDTMAEALGISKMTARRSAEFLVIMGLWCASRWGQERLFTPSTRRRSGKAPISTRNMRHSIRSLLSSDGTLRRLKHRSESWAPEQTRIRCPSETRKKMTINLWRIVSNMNT